MMRNNVLAKHRPLLNEVLFVLVRVSAETKAKWSSPELDPGVPKKCPQPYFILHPYLTDRCYTCVLLLQQMQTRHTCKGQRALHSLRHNRKMRGGIGFARLTELWLFYPQNWKQLEIHRKFRRFKGCLYSKWKQLTQMPLYFKAPR